MVRVMSKLEIRCKFAKQTIPGGLRVQMVPELTRRPHIQLNDQVLLRGCVKTVLSPQVHYIHARVLTAEFFNVHARFDTVLCLRKK
jgi:hypothetical protein